MEDWGYKFTATPTYPAKAATGARTHWLVRLEFELVQASSALAAVMVAGTPWQPQLEGAHQAWMENPLIRYAHHSLFVLSLTVTLTNHLPGIY